MKTFLDYRNKYNFIDFINFIHFMRPCFMEPLQQLYKTMPILGKRKFNEAFDISSYDDSRYNQHIDDKFFVANIGHCVTLGHGVTIDNNIINNKGKKY